MSQVVVVGCIVAWSVGAVRWVRDWFRRSLLGFVVRCVVVSWRVLLVVWLCCGCKVVRRGVVTQRDLLEKANHH